MLDSLPLLLEFFIEKQLHGGGACHAGLLGDFRVRLDVDLHPQGPSFELIEDTLQLRLQHMAGAAAGGGVNHQQGLITVVIKLAQGIATFLPKGGGIEIVGVADGSGLAWARRLRFDVLPFHRTGQLLVT